MTKEEKLKNLFRYRNINAEVSYIKTGETFSSFYVRLNNGAKISQIQALSQEIGLKLLAISEPIISADYVTGLVKIDLMFKPHPTVDFHKLLSLTNSNYDLPLVLGIKNEETLLSLDLAKLPHLLVAGSTGSGKSMLLHTFINTLMSKADSNIEFVMIDPKQIEFSLYKDCKHLAVPILDVMGDAVYTLNDLICEMETRFKILQKANCRDIIEYRALKGSKAMSFKVLVIDELADLNYVCGKKFMDKLVQLVQKSRAAGIHAIVATQHPSAKNIPGELKANFPCRIACKVSSSTHSRVILDQNGAEKLFGKGDALITGAFNSLERFKAPLVDFDKVKEEQKKIRKSFFLRWFK